jgi:hypothetical protein
LFTIYFGSLHQWSLKLLAAAVADYVIVIVTIFADYSVHGDMDSNTLHKHHIDPNGDKPNIFL